MPGPRSLLDVQERSLGIDSILHEGLKALKAGGIGEHELVDPGNLHLDINGVLFQPAHFQEWLISGIQD